jgi:hypothetical protein
MRVLHALSLLLFESATLSDPVVLQHLQRELRTTATTMGDLVAAYKSLWQRFN